MPTTINADTVVGGAVVTADASGVLALQAAGNTGLTLNSSRAIGVGASPSFGSSGQVLTSGGSSAAPTWTTPSAGSWVTLGSGTITGNPTTIDFETGFTDSTYSAIVIMLTDVFTTSSGNPTYRFKQAGSYVTSGYEYQILEASVSSVSTNRGTSQTGMILASVQVTNTTAFSDLLIIKNRFSTTTAGPSISTYGTQTGSGVAKLGVCQGVLQASGAVQGVRFYLSGGGGGTQLTGGSYSWYGIKAS